MTIIREVQLKDPASAGWALAEIFERAVGEAGRRDQGAVYTPSDVVDFMVREAIAARLAGTLDLDLEPARLVVDGDFDHLSDAQAGTVGRLLKGLRLLDPAAGAGAFLAGAATRISALAERLHGAGVPGLRDLRTPGAALRRCCRGYELDADATAIANVVLTLTTYDEHHRSAAEIVSRHDPLLAGMGREGTSGWDIILMNPPYMGEKHTRARLGDEVSQKLRQIDGFSRDLLTHFVFRGMSSVRPNGVLSAIVSDTSFTIEATADLRRQLIDKSLLLSVAWCQPFRSVAVRGGVITVARRAPQSKLDVYWTDAPANTLIADAPQQRISRMLLRQLPGRPIYKPSPAGLKMIEHWTNIDSLDERWQAVMRRKTRDADVQQTFTDGSWTLLGSAMRSGQGLATGDDRHFVGVLAGTPEAARAAERQRRILDVIRTDPDRREEWHRLRALLVSGQQLGSALILLSNRGQLGELPGRKPFQIVSRELVRTSRLGREEAEHGIAGGPSWIPYETSDRSSGAGGSRWIRENPIVIDWSVDAVSMLRRRRAAGPLRPVLRNEDLWFRGGVTHNRIASYLRARMMPKHAIFSSESPVYVPNVSWLTAPALLALLNAPVVEFALKTFLASRNHIEVGHIRRLPVPVLRPSQTQELDRLGKQAVANARADSSALSDIEHQIDRFTRDLYDVGSLSLTVDR